MRLRQPLGVSMYERIQDDVVEGALAAGETLTEGALSQRYGVSRTPVREALLALESEGFLLRNQSGSLYIPSLTYGEAVHLYRTRAVLEGLAAHQLAGRLDDSARADLKRVTGRIRLAVDAGEQAEVIKLGQEFHRRLVLLSGNPYVNRALNLVQPQVNRYRRLAMTMNDTWTADAVEEHERILHAIANGDANKAEDVVRQHVLRGLSPIESAFSGSPVAG